MKKLEKNESNKKNKGNMLSGKAIKGSLFALILTFNCVSGDVFQLTNKNDVRIALVPGADTVAAFSAFLRQNLSGLPAWVSDPFATAPADLKYQMLGYAVYFPYAADGSVVSTAQQVYVAKKRKRNASLANNNPAVGGNVLNFSTVEHTERQLAMQLASVAAGGGNGINATINLHNMVMIPLAAAPIAGIPPARLAGLTGEFHIYTQGSPCTGRNEGNKQFSCIDYYKALHQSMPFVICTFSCLFSQCEHKLELY